MFKFRGDTADMEPVIYEIISKKAQPADLEIGDCRLRLTALSPEDAVQIAKEAGAWQLTEYVRYTETLFWRGDEERSGGYYVLRASRELVVKNGRFYGMVLRFSDESGYGMSYHSTPRLGLVCIDGKRFGVTTRESSRCSTETDRTEAGEFTLERKGSLHG